MKAIPTSKQAALQKKFAIQDLLKEAIEHHGHCEAARASVLNAQRVALWHAWQAGIRLNTMKKLIPRGDWIDWLELNFCRPLKVSIRTAQIYMKIDRDNGDLGEKAKTQRVAPTEADLQLLTQLKSDTIRKYAFTFIPEKHQPNKDKDIKFERPYSFLNIVNEYNRVRYRHITGLETVDFVEAREETDELYEFLQWLHGDSPNSPWDSYAYDGRRNITSRRKTRRPEEIPIRRLGEIFSRTCPTASFQSR